MGRMMAFVRQLLGGGPLPANLAGLAVEAGHQEAVDAVGGLRFAVELRFELRKVRWSRGTIDFDGRGDENLVAPHDGRSAAAAGQFGFPADIRLWAPSDGWVGFRRRAIRFGAAPVMP